MAKIEKADFNSQGDVGQNTIWDGPLSQVGRPHGVGSSSGITGMKLKISFNTLFCRTYYYESPSKRRWVPLNHRFTRRYHLVVKLLLKVNLKYGPALMLLDGVCVALKLVDLVILVVNNNVFI